MELRVGPAEVEGALDVWRAALAAAGSRPPAARTARVREKLVAPDALLVTAVDDDDVVVGMALGEWGRAGGGSGELEPGLLHLSLLAVRPARRRQGLGTALVEGLADAAYLRGARRMSLWTDTAQAFLAACGLVPTGSRQATPAGSTLTQYAAELDPPLTELAVQPGLRLGQLLKLAALVETGAQAKALLAVGAVQVNGQVELRRGRQLADGDVVVARDRAVHVRLSQGPVSEGPVSEGPVSEGPDPPWGILDR